MSAGATLHAGDEPAFTRKVFEAILDGMGPHDPFRENFRLDERGVWINDPTSCNGLEWHPMCEFMAPGSPNPLDEPWLPFPFTGRQLAALMIDGWGQFIGETYGDWAEGPDQEELKSIGVLGGKAKEALAAAYEAYRQAETLAPRLDRNLAVADRDLVDQYSEAREAAIDRERLREPGIPGDEYTERLRRVNESVAHFDQPLIDARRAANCARSRWRRAMVQHLLLPIEKVEGDAFECQILRALPPGLRARALHQQTAQREFENSAEGEAHWALVCELSDLKRELRRWQLMNPQTVTEALLHDTKLKELEAKLADVNRRVDNWQWVPEACPGAGAVAVAPLASAAAGTLGNEADVDRQRRRLDDLRHRFGGDWVRRNGGWGARDRQSGAFGKLVAQERTNGSKNFSEKSVRKDLDAAAQREADHKRAAGAMPFR